MENVKGVVGNAVQGNLAVVVTIERAAIEETGSEVVNAGVLTLEGGVSEFLGKSVSLEVVVVRAEFQVLCFGLKRLR